MSSTNKTLAYSLSKSHNFKGTWAETIDQEWVWKVHLHDALQSGHYWNEIGLVISGC